MDYAPQTGFQRKFTTSIRFFSYHKLPPTLQKFSGFFFRILYVASLRLAIPCLSESIFFFVEKQRQSVFSTSNCQQSFFYFSQFFLLLQHKFRLKFLLCEAYLFSLLFFCFLWIPDSTLSMFTGHASERSSSSLQLDPADVSRVSAEARRIATEETLAARSPLTGSGPSTHEVISSSASSDPPSRSDPSQPEVSIIHDSAADQPVPSSYGAAAPRWDAKALAKFLPAGDGSGSLSSAASHSAPPQLSALPALTLLKEEDPRLSSREKAIKLLNANEREHRGRARTFDGQKDDGKYFLHSLRFEAWPHVNPADLYHLGLERHRTVRPPPFFHDLSHLEGGLMVNPRAYVIANSISEASLSLEIFRPGTLSLPESDRPIHDMRETQKAWSIYQALTRRAKPWDASIEVLNDYLLEHEWFQPLERPVGGYYRRPSYPAFRAVIDLISAVNRSVVQLLPFRSIMLNTNEVKRIHQQRCSETPEHWAHTQQHVSTRNESSRRDKPSAATSRKNKPPPPSTTNKDSKMRIKEMVSKSTDSICITFNLGASCPRPASGNGCLFTKQGTTTVLEHSCAYSDAAGVRCKKPHAMATNH